MVGINVMEGYLTYLTCFLQRTPWHFHDFPEVSKRKSLNNMGISGV